MTQMGSEPAKPVFECPETAHVDIAVSMSSKFGGYGGICHRDTNDERMKQNMKYRTFITGGRGFCPG
jgi:hypothetical protein